MTKQSTKPRTRTDSAAPGATRHLSHEQKQALDIAADAEHSDGRAHENEVKEIQRLDGEHGGSARKKR